MKAKAASLFTIVRIVGILGPRGSGVYWLRHMVEQMTGIYTGSPYNEYPHIFKAEGDTKEVRMPNIGNPYRTRCCKLLSLPRLGNCLLFAAKKFLCSGHKSETLVQGFVRHFCDRVVMNLHGLICKNPISHHLQHPLMGIPCSLRASNSLGDAFRRGKTSPL